MKEKYKRKGDFQIPEEALEEIKSQSELDDHLGYEKHQTNEKHGDNSRNGFSKKTLKTNIGDISLDVPRDRESSFDPIIVPKHQRMSARIWRH